MIKLAKRFSVFLVIGSFLFSNVSFALGADLNCLRAKALADRQVVIPAPPRPTYSQMALLQFYATTLPQIQAYIFDIGGTLADEDEPTPEMIKALAALLNTGKNVAIISGKSEKAFKGWIESKLMPLVDKSKRPLFKVYGDRVTKIYQANEAGQLIEVSRISFPAVTNLKRATLQIAEQEAKSIQAALLEDISISPAVKDIIRANPLKAKAGDEFVQLCSNEDIDVKGDKTAGKAREIIRARLESALRQNGLLTEELMVVLDGKKGAFVKNKQADKPGAVENLKSALGLSKEQALYVADQFAGKSTADLPVAQIGLYCLNVGEDEATGYDNVLNLAGGPQAARRFVEEAVDIIKGKEESPEKVLADFLGMKESAVRAILKAYEMMYRIPETIVYRINNSPTADIDEELRSLANEMFTMLSSPAGFKDLDLDRLYFFAKAFGELNIVLMREYVRIFGEIAAQEEPGAAMAAMTNMRKIEILSSLFRAGKQLDIAKDRKDIATYLEILDRAHQVIAFEMTTKGPEFTSDRIKAILEKEEADRGVAKGTILPGYLYFCGIITSSPELPSQTRAIMTVGEAAKVLRGVIENIQANVKGRANQEFAIEAVFNLRRGIISPEKAREILLLSKVDIGLAQAWITQATSPLAMARRYLYISVIQGGTNLTVSVNDATGNPVRSITIKWTEAFPDRDIKQVNPDEILDLMKAKIAEVLRQEGLGIKDMKKIFVSTAGPLNEKEGILGVPDPTPNLPYSNYPFLLELRKRLADLGGEDLTREWSHDGRSGVIGEFSGEGDGTFVIWGTGMNFTSKKKGEYFIDLVSEEKGGAITECGHATIGRPDPKNPMVHHFRFMGKRLGQNMPRIVVRDVAELPVNKRSRAVLGAAAEEEIRRGDAKREDFIWWHEGEREVEDLISGPNIAALLSDKHLLASRFGGQISDYAQMNKAEDLTELAKNANPYAIKVIIYLGHEMGRALAAFMAVYPDEKFAANIKIGSGVGENLGKGITDERGVDLLYGAIQYAAQEELVNQFAVHSQKARTLASGITRSELTAEVREGRAGAPAGLPQGPVGFAGADIRIPAPAQGENEQVIAVFNSFSVPFTATSENCAIEQVFRGALSATWYLASKESGQKFVVQRIDARLFEQAILPGLERESVAPVSEVTYNEQGQGQVWRVFNFVENIPVKALAELEGIERVTLNFNNRTNLEALESAHAALGKDVVQKSNQVVIPQEYLENAELRDIIMATKAEDVLIIPLDQAIALATNQEGASNRIVLLKDTDLKDLTRQNAACRILELRNYNFLHLAASLELARSILAGNKEAIKTFLGILTHAEIKFEDVDRLTAQRIILIILPPIAIFAIEDINSLNREYAKFIVAA